MNKEELVSVLVCSYKEEKYIEDCLNSIFDQTYQNIELIIANDCSDDRTFDIAKEWVKKNGKRFTNCVVYKNEANLGISKNFNGLIRRAKGKFIKPISADDIIISDGIENEVNFLKGNNEYAIVYGNCVIIDELEKYPILAISKKRLFYNTIPKYGYNLTEALIENCFIATPTVMYRKETFQQYGLFREDLAFEDWEYWLRLSSRGAGIGYIDSIIVAYRIRMGSNSHTGKGKEEERRFLNNTETEEIILNEYQKYASEEVIDAFWDRVIRTCIKNEYKETMQKVLKKKPRITTRCKLMLIMYKAHVFKPIYSVWQVIHRKQ